MKPTLDSAIASFGAKAKEKLSNPAISGQPEDQIRAPFEHLLEDLAQLCQFPKGTVIPVGESSISDLKTRPDYAVTVHGALAGFIELKAPGKGADPRKLKDPHDRAQWVKLSSLPNLIYSDGNSFCLCQNGEPVMVVRLTGDIESSGESLHGPSELLALFESFLRWQPLPPKSAKDLAHTTARLCRLLRDEVTEQLAAKSEALTALAEDWRKLLFPDATDERFADGYAQAVTFGLLMARARNIELATGLPQVAAQLSQTNSLIGTALRLLTDNVGNQKTLKTSLGTLTRVLDAVDWAKISKNKADAWLYFYEDFLEVYDNQLRKKTGSYYTPPEVVAAMVNLVDEALRSTRYGLHSGLAAPAVTLCDPATGTGTFILGVLRKIADTISEEQGAGAVPEAVNAAIKRLIAFEIQLGPFAVAQLRILAELVELTGGTPKNPVRMFVTDTLGNPHDDAEWLPSFAEPIGKSRRDANKIKRDEPITVVLGNPPYKEKAKGKGGWVEEKVKNSKDLPPLAAWNPPSAWKAGAHSKHLRNLYIYFWRWATWKVYDHHPNNNTGIVCFITVSGFLSGPGFQKMRDYLRRTCDDIWIIDCSPEGHQPGVNTRIFQGVQHPVCIVLASRSAKKKSELAAKVRFQALPSGARSEKFAALGKLRLVDENWTDCPSEWRAPFLPESAGAWAMFPKLEDLFVYNGSGVMPGRTWIIAPDSASLENRWTTLLRSKPVDMELLFHPHLSGGKLGDRHSHRIVQDGLPGYPSTNRSVADESGPCLAPLMYGFRSFDRQWIIPDNRLINRPNPDLWKSLSNQQIYLTAFTEESPSNGPALSLTPSVPDLHHYKGSFGGRVFPLWQDAEATTSNFRPALLPFLSKQLGIPVSAEDMMAYIAAIAAHPAYTARFQEDLLTPGLRIPFTASKETFEKASQLGRRVIWLHAFGERMADPNADRPHGPPRVSQQAARPYIPKGGTIPQSADSMPDFINYDAAKKRLLVGEGYIDNVEPAVWNYEVSGKQVLVQWFSYRKLDRSRPIIGDRREPSPLAKIQPDHWLAEYTTELINVLNVLTCLTELEPQQSQLLDEVCSGPLISEDELKASGALQLPLPAKKKKQEENKNQPYLPGTVTTPD